MSDTSLTDPISQQFSQISQMFSPQSSGGGSSGSGGGGLTPEPIQGDSLTSYLRSLTNSEGATGQNLLSHGQGVFGAGTGTIQGGIDILGQPLNYFSALAGGDPNLMARAVAPTANAVSDQFSTAAQSTSAGMPRSGYRSTAMASLPFQKAAQIGNMEEQLQPMANQQVAGIGQYLTQLGLNEQQIANVLTQLGIGSTSNAASQLLARRGQNVQQDMSNMSALAGGLSNVLSGPLSDLMSGEFAKIFPPPTDGGGGA